MDCWIVIKAFSSEVATGSREENVSKRESEARFRTELQGWKLQNFALWSYCFAAIVRVFHAQQPAISSRLPWQHDGPGTKAPFGNEASIDLPRARS
jgi:hypothetical protein